MKGADLTQINVMQPRRARAQMPQPVKVKQRAQQPLSS